MSVVAKHIIVKGKVQGVFYRKSTRRKAEELHLNGWVKNLENGDVEITVEGEEEIVKIFTVWCAQGPERAKVTDIFMENTPVVGFSGFSIK